MKTSEEINVILGQIVHTWLTRLSAAITYIAIWRVIQLKQLNG